MKTILLCGLTLTLYLTSFGQDNNQINNNLSSIGQFLNPSGREFLFPDQYGRDPGKNNQDFASLADSAHQSIFDTTSAAFKLAQRTYYTYDLGGLLIRKLKKSPDKSGNWKNFSLDTLTYAGPFIKKIESRQWDSQLSSWRNILRYEYTYDSVNVLTSLKTSTWNTGTSEWEPSDLQSYTYNDLNLLTYQLNQVWNSVNSIWEVSSRITYTYTGTQLVGNLYEQWDKTNAGWVKLTFTAYTYSAGLNTETLTQKYSSSTFAWENQFKSTFTYTSLGKVENQTSLVWNTDHWTNSTLLANSYSGEDLVESYDQAMAGSFECLAQLPGSGNLLLPT
jgi:hypothetical protein